jgi:hypothetical protein
VGRNPCPLTDSGTCWTFAVEPRGAGTPSLIAGQPLHTAPSLAACSATRRAAGFHTPAFSRVPAATSTEVVYESPTSGGMRVMETAIACSFETTKLRRRGQATTAPVSVDLHGVRMPAEYLTLWGRLNRWVGDWAEADRRREAARQANAAC